MGYKEKHKYMDLFRKRFIKYLWNILLFWQVLANGRKSSL